MKKFFVVFVVATALTMVAPSCKKSGGGHDSTAVSKRHAKKHVNRKDQVFPSGRGSHSWNSVAIPLSFSFAFLALGMEWRRRRRQITAA